jgi:hypothetical protein
MKKTNWLAVSLIAIVVILVMFWIGTLVGGWGSGGYGMMGNWGNWGNRGGGMMGNWGYSPFGWFGMGLGMLFMGLIPLGILALVIYGVVMLARNSGNIPPAAPASPCPNCGKATQADWKNCPYCGTALK